MLGLPTFAVDTDVDVAFDLKVGGDDALSSAVDAHLKALTSVSVTLETDGLGAFALDFDAWDGPDGVELLVPSGTFAVEEFVEISLGHTTSASLIYGMITDVGISYTHSGISLSVSGYDVRHLLRLGRFIRVHQDKNVLEIAQAICQERGLTVKVEKGTQTFEPIVEQQTAEESDYEYIDRLLGEVGYVLDVEGDEVIIREPLDPPFGPMTSYGLTDMQSFSGSDSVLEQVDGVRVIGTTPERLRVAGEAGKTDKGCSVITLHRSVASLNEAQLIADSELASRQKKKLTASATVRGNSALLPGTWINISDIPTFKGAYRIAKAVHSWTPGAGYTTALTLEKDD